MGGEILCRHVHFTSIWSTLGGIPVQPLSTASICCIILMTSLQLVHGLSSQQCTNNLCTMLSLCPMINTLVKPSNNRRP